MNDKPASVRQSYRTEFPDFELDVAIPDDWHDISWHNDACPSWLVGDDDDGLRIYVDYAAPSAREYPGIARFAVFRHVVGRVGNLIFTGDDWPTVLAFVVIATERKGPGK